ncbi:MAG: 3-deoxy-manno-octulosonate cytidylyltransferase [Alphaproteobacteria bacterium]
MTMTMTVMVVIPSRLASTRLPNKPLADIAGKPMIVRVAEQAVKANVGSVVVAAGDPEIVQAVEAAGFKAVLTDADLPSGSDRIWQAVQRLVAKGAIKPEIIINVQGDEPLLPPELIVQCVEAFKAHPEADVVTYGHTMTNPAEIDDAAKVKIAMTPSGRALYFSRSIIPHGATQAVRHIGFYGYRYAALERFVAAPPSPLELQEKLEQLRGLEMGLVYHVEMTPHAPIGVDTQEHLEHVRKVWK